MMSIFKGYPYGEAKSKEIFPVSKRPVGQQIDEAIKDGVLLDASLVSQYSVALHEAEEQIKDLQTKYPFIPEDYGFKYLGISVEHERPLYKSNDENVKLTRFSDNIWIIYFENQKLVDDKEEFNVNKARQAFVVKVSSESEMFTLFSVLGITHSIKTKKDEDNNIIGDTIELGVSSVASIAQVAEKEENNESDKGVRVSDEPSSDATGN